MRANIKGEAWSERDTTKCSEGCKGTVNSYLGTQTSVMLHPAECICNKAPRTTGLTTSVVLPLSNLCP